MPMTAEEKRAYMLEYNKRPDVIARQKERKATAEYKVAHAEHEKGRRAAIPKRVRTAYERERWQKRKADPEYMEKARAYQREWMREYRKNPEVKAANSATGKRYRERPEWRQQARGYTQRYAYGLTQEQWGDLFTAQGACCAVCKSTVPHSKKGWQTDHCHDTGKVRGILCADCNRVVHSRATVGTLDAALAYLKKAP